MSTVVDILDKSGNQVARVKNFYPIDESGMILRYSKELSDYGTATFRIATQDPMLTTFGDVALPHASRVRITRNQIVIWEGGIIDNPQRNKKFIEIKAAEYLWYLDKVLIRRDASVTAGDGLNNFRTVNSGTLSSFITDLITKGATDFGSGHMLSGMTAGTIDNPNFPPSLGTGPWTFSSTIAIQFDYMSVLYVIKMMGIYSGYDFRLNNDLTFDFVKEVGKKLYDFSFDYGTHGNVVDYNLPRLGSRMVNSLVGIAATDSGDVFHAMATNTKSVNTYGKFDGAAAYSDVKNKKLLRERMTQELKFLKDPNVTPVNVVVDEKGYPLGQYNIGDTVKVRVKDHNIDYNNWRKIVGITVNLHNTGREITTVQTNQEES